jgi:soluble lytic murein transglycosylase-like protein
VNHRVDSGTTRFSPHNDSAKLIAELERLLANWERRLSSSARPDGPGLAELRQWAVDLQARAELAPLPNAARWLSQWNRITEPRRTLDRAALSTSLEALAELIKDKKNESSSPDSALKESTLTTTPAVRTTSSSAPPVAITPPPLLSMAPETALAPTPHAPLAPTETDRPPSSSATRSASVLDLAFQTIFRLRAFGRSGQSAMAPDQAAGRATSHTPLLGLKGFSRALPSPEVPPPLLSNSLPALPPELGRPDPAHAPSPTTHAHGMPAHSAAKPRPPARSWQGAAPPPRARPSTESSGSWHLGALTALVVGGLAVAGVIAWGRFTEPTEKTDSAGISAPSGSTQSISASSAARSSSPRSPSDSHDLLKEMRNKAHAQVGEESPELSSWIDEQAALQTRLLETGECDGSRSACAILFKNRQELSTPRNSRATAKMSPAASTRPRSSWLDGYKVPTIPVADNEHVHQIFQKFIDTNVGRERFKSLLFNCGAYSELIQAKLAKYELPESLLAVVYAESGCNPKATSPVGAGGLWQFMPEAARAYHLDIVDDVIDERCSPPKSTEASIHFLADLYKKFNSWELALAAYNMGPYGLSARLQRAGEGADFWDLFEAGLLPAETAGYVPTIEAFALILANLRKLDFGVAQTIAPEDTMDLEPPPGTRLGLIANAASTSTTHVKDLNPELKSNVVPDVPGKRIVVRVPKKAIWSVNEKLEDLLARGSMDDTCVSPDFDWGGKVKAKRCLKKPNEPQNGVPPAPQRR